MERCFNTLKNECIYLYKFSKEENLYQAVEEFAYVTYNHVRPYSSNEYQTPWATRFPSLKLRFAYPPFAISQNFAFEGGGGL